jgi:serine/threonine-protein kinase
VLWALAGAGILASVAAGGRWISTRRDAKPDPSKSALAAATASKSIAVMPLVNISRDTSDAYFADGMSADLTNALSRIPGLRVAAGTADAIREQTSDPVRLGKALNVNMVLVGTVQRDQGRLRVTARLVNTADGFTVWSDMFESDAKDLFKVQDDISREIVDAISPELLAAAPVDAATVTAATQDHGTSDLQAYDLYLRGRYYFQKRGEPALRQALDYFHQAVHRDSTFARAYAGMANVYAMLPLYANVRTDSVMPLALAAINRAVALDSMLPEAFASRGSLLQALWRWNDAERDYRRALSLDPNDAQAHQWYGELLLLTGRTPAARAELARAVALDPLSPVTLGSYALALSVAHAPDSAIMTGKRAVDLDSTLLVTRFMLGSVYLQAGRYADAVRELENAARLDTSSVQTEGLLGYAYAKTGKSAEAVRMAKALEAADGSTSGATAAAARVYLGLGNNDKALALLSRAAEEKDSFFSSEALGEGYFDPVRSDPRFVAVRRKVGLAN